MPNMPYDAIEELLGGCVPGENVRFIDQE